METWFGGRIMKTTMKAKKRVEQLGQQLIAGTFAPRWGVSSLAGDPPPGSGPLHAVCALELWAQVPLQLQNVHGHVDLGLVCARLELGCCWLCRVLLPDLYGSGVLLPTNILYLYCSYIFNI